MNKNNEYGIRTKAWQVSEAFGPSRKILSIRWDEMWLQTELPASLSHLKGLDVHKILWPSENPKDHREMQAGGGTSSQWG